MEAYGRRCVVCLAPAVHLHHLLPKSSWPSYRDDIRNLCPLCDTCHHSVHTTKTLRVWSEYLHKRMEVVRNAYD